MPDSDDIVFINPYDIKGGASMGTFRLFSYFRKYITPKARLFVVVRQSLGVPGVFRLSRLARFVFYLQAGFNKFLCYFLSASNLPVAFTLFVPFSFPALLLYLRTCNASSSYLHSMGSGFSCPISFSLLLQKASVVKTADDWYLTGGCHYSLDCTQWQSGCKACPHMNSFGQLIIRINWIIKRYIVYNTKGFVFVSPSSWLSRRYKTAYPGRCTVIYNSSDTLSSNIEQTSPSRYPFTSSNVLKSCELSSASLTQLTLGLPVTYLRDKRKGFIDALTPLVHILENYPVRLVLCGGDSEEYFRILCSKISVHSPGAIIECLGSLSPISMPFFYEKLDFTLHFARFDNSPNVVTESLSSCVPVIALNHAGSPEHVFASSAGFIVDQVDDLPALVLSIISGHVDINALKKKAYAYSNKVLSPCSMASAYFKLFNQST